MEITQIFYIDEHENSVEMGFESTERIFQLPKESIDLGLLSTLEPGDEVFIASNSGRDLMPEGPDSAIKYVYVREKLFDGSGRVIYRPLYFSEFDFSSRSLNARV